MTVDPSAATAAEPARPASSATQGQALGKYRLDRVIGSGGMGIVWAAFDPDLERAVALKLLHAANNEPTLRSRLLREARAMARLKHPNVLTVYEVGTDQNRDYIAMELVDGDNLDEWLRTRPPRGEILDALLAAGRGLAAAHAAGLVHRDFKPHNVLRSRDGHVYVTDFGLARGQIEDGADVEQVAVAALPDELASGSHPRRTPDSVLDSPLTQTGVMIGTPAYMAPEQFVGRAPDPRSDQFAFCVTAWEALTGTRPFRGANLDELRAAAGGGVSALEAELPPRIRAVLARGLDPSPAARWPDLPSLLRALEQAFAAPATPPGGGRRRWWLGGLAVVALGAGAGALVWSRGGGGGNSIDADGCMPGTRAFASAWSQERRDALVRASSYGTALGGTVMLDEMRRQWVRAFDNACAVSPRTSETRARIRCLLDVRDAVASTVQAQAPGAFDFSPFGTLIARIAMCDPHTFGRLPMFDDDDDPPEPPEPPVPDVPGRP
ncbi:MAG: serine/threonine-protein kinase [Kofleriaceae bacterium]